MRVLTEAGTSEGEPKPERKDLVREWRLEQALALGLGIVEANLFADCGADLEALRHLIRDKGASPEQAARIIL